MGSLRSFFTSIFCNRSSEKVERGPAEEKEGLQLANISHEIRTPVNGIVGFVQLLKETELTGDQEELVNTIYSSSMHLLNLVNDVLDLSKINAEMLALEHISFNLPRQVEDTVETYAVAASKKDITLSLFIDPDIAPELMGDPLKLSQVLLNLVSNAIKFTPALGKVKIRVERFESSSDGEILRFSVEDTGIGIEPESQKSIFDAFSQADASVSRRFGGTGLGLTISSRLVELMGGKISLESARGRGSCFSFILGFQKDKTQKHENFGKAYPEVSAGILLVGDEEKEQEDLYRYLEKIVGEVRYYTENQLLQEVVGEMPEVLFVNRTSRSSGEFSKELADKGVKLVWIVQLAQRDTFSLFSSSACKVLYAPVNFSKIKRSLDTCLQQKEKRAMEAGEQFSGVRALVVDDNLINQKLLERILLNSGISVDVVSDGIDALAIRKERDYDIIFMDIQMPMMDGVEASRCIVSHEEEKGLKHIPIIALTGNDTSGKPEVYLEAGMDGFMQKPIDVDMLRSHLNRYCKLKEEKQEVVKKEESAEEKTIEMDFSIKKESIVDVDLTSFEGKGEYFSVEPHGPKEQDLGEEEVVAKVTGSKITYIDIPLEK